MFSNLEMLSSQATAEYIVSKLDNVVSYSTTDIELSVMLRVVSEQGIDDGFYLHPSAMRHLVRLRNIAAQQTTKH